MHTKAHATILAVLAVVLCGARTGPARPRTMAYVLQADALAGTRAQAAGALADSGRDLIVIDYSFDGSAEGKWTPAELDHIRAGRPGRKVAAYLSVGEAEDYRAYWQQQWDADRDGVPDPGAPAWLLPANPNWPGCYAVRYWHAEWQCIVMGLVDEMLAQGFDGLFLDKVDAFEDFERAGAGQDYRAEMVRVVGRIASRARATRGRDFLMVPQNGEALLTDPGYLAAVSAVVAEDLITDGTAAQPRDALVWRLQFLVLATRAGRPVLLVEYPTAEGLRRYARRVAARLGLALLITDRDLTGLGETQPPP